MSNYDVISVKDYDGSDDYSQFAVVMVTDVSYAVVGSFADTNDVTIKYPGLAAFSSWYSGIHGYVATSICTWGVVANSANILVLTRRSMLSSTNFILTWLAVADLLTMSCYIPFAIQFYVRRDPRLEFPSTESLFWIGFLIFNVNFSVVCHTVAIWLTITLAVCRYLCIRFPTRGTAMCRLDNVKKVIGTVYVASIIACVPNYTMSGISERQFNMTSMSSSPSNVTSYESGAHYINNSTTCFKYYTLVDSENAVLSQFNYWIQAILFKLVPCVLLTTLTVLLLTAMREANARRAKLKSQGRRDESDRARECDRTTAMLVAVVGLFQLTELPQGVLTLGSIFVENFYHDVYSPLGDLLDIMALLNNSITFILYCTMSRQFRQTFVETICGRKE